MAAEALDAEAPLIAIPACGVLPSATTPASPAASLYFATVHQVQDSRTALSKTFRMWSGMLGLQGYPSLPPGGFDVRVVLQCRV